MHIPVHQCLFIASPLLFETGGTERTRGHRESLRKASFGSGSGENGPRAADDAIASARKVMDHQTRLREGKRRSSIIYRASRRLKPMVHFFPALKTQLAVHPHPVRVPVCGVATFEHSQSAVDRLQLCDGRSGPLPLAKRRGERGKIECRRRLTHE